MNTITLHHCTDMYTKRQALYYIDVYKQCHMFDTVDGKSRKTGQRHGVVFTDNFGGVKSTYLVYITKRSYVCVFLGAEMDTKSVP